MPKILKKLPYILCFIIAFVFGMKQLREPDIWWQLLSGRWMLDNGAVTKTDMFSYTVNGTRWINVKWLYEIIIGILEKGMGPEGVMLLQAVVNMGILWALFHTLKHIKKQLNIPASNLFTITGVLLFFVMVEYRMTGRPEMISHLMCALMLSYFRCYPELKWKQMIWPVLLQCIWANMHEGYPVGMVMIGSFAGGSFIAYLLSKDKVHLQTGVRAIALFAAAAVAILINPNGIQLWKQPFEIYRQVNVNKYTIELFTYKEPEYWTIQAKIYIALLVLTILFWIVRLLQARKEKDKRFTNPVTIGYLLLIPLFGYLSLSANRNIPFAAIALFPSIPIMMAWMIEKLKIHAEDYYKQTAKYSLVICSVICFSFYVMIVSDRYYKAIKSPNEYGIRINMLHTPTASVDFIKQHNIKGPAFSDYFVSSYFLWALYPDFKSYIDLRDLDIFPAPFFDDYFSMYNNPNKFDSLDRKFNFNYVVLSLPQLTELQKKLYYGQGYNMIHVDPVSVIFLKQNEGNVALNSDLSIQKLFTWPQPIEEPGWASVLNRIFNPIGNAENEEEGEEMQAIHAAKFYTGLGSYPLALKMILPAMYNLRDNAIAQFTIGDIYSKYASVTRDPAQQKARIDSAIYCLERAKELDEDLIQVYTSLANVYLTTGNYQIAQRQLKDYIERDNNNDYVYYMLGVTERLLWMQSSNKRHNDEMIKAMKKSVELNPKNGKAYLYLADGYLVQDNMEEARVYLNKFIASGNPLLKEEEILFNELKQKTGIQ